MFGSKSSLDPLLRPWLDLAQSWQSCHHQGHPPDTFVKFMIYPGTDHQGVRIWLAYAVHQMHPLISEKVSINPSFSMLRSGQRWLNIKKNVSLHSNNNLVFKQNLEPHPGLCHDPIQILLPHIRTSGKMTVVTPKCVETCHLPISCQSQDMGYEWRVVHSDQPTHPKRSDPTGPIGSRKN